MIGLLGAGTTGSHVLEQGSALDWRVFNSENPPSLDQLNECEAVVVFVPGNVLALYLDLLIESTVPVICGTTGYEYPKDFDQLMRERNQIWIHANNFSPAMSVVRNLLSQLGKSLSVLDDFSLKIEEVHHVKKLDAPSGTALRWQEWLGVEKEVSIDSIREGDVVGIHKLIMESELEKIELSHKSKDRALFAKGALLALSWIQKNKLRAGYHRFESVIDKELQCDQD